MREGFIVDEDEDEDDRRRRRHERKKRRREEREEEEAGLDDEDLDLIGELEPSYERRAPTQPKLKRLKRGHREDLDKRLPKGIGDIFDSDEEDERSRPRGVEDEFADFIEEDFSDNDADKDGLNDEDVARPKARKFLGGVTATADLDEAAIEDMREAFGTGAEYDWALAMQEQDDEERPPGIEDPDGLLAKGIELKDVFEPSQLAEKMLTDEDNIIRQTDVPERFQLARKPYQHLTLTEQQIKDESIWISNLMLPKKDLDRASREPFQKAVAKVLEFLIVDEYEVPFIFQHRKDYLIHARQIEISPDPYRPDAPTTISKADKLLDQSDLWNIYDHDLKFRGLIDKRNVLEASYNNLKESADIQDNVFEDLLPKAISMEELQDVQDYLHFQHSARLADLALVNGSQANGNHRRPGASKILFERIRQSPVYDLVRAYGISADAFAQNASKEESRRQYTVDPAQRPDDMADEVVNSDYPTGEQCLKAARMMFTEEIFMSPRMRKVIRGAYYRNGVVDCIRTEKGLRKIDEQHPYYEFKYLRNQQLGDIARNSGRYLKMLKAEEEGLVEVKVRVPNMDTITKRWYSDIESDNYSEIAEAWNRERREALNSAILKLDKIMVKGVKEHLKDACENVIEESVRDEYTRKLDQAPYKPKGMVLGTIPRVLALSNGTGVHGRDAICWAYVEEDGRVLENGKYIELVVGSEEHATEDSPDVAKFVEAVKRRKPHVNAVTGISHETKKRNRQVLDIVEAKNLRGAEWEDEDGRDRRDLLDVVIVNDEVARLYQNSERAFHEHPGLPPLTKYCVGLAKYLQNPMKEYASLGRDIISIKFDPNQSYVPEDKILHKLETAIVDMVNICGVEINDAVTDSYTANLLPYVCGLGPRKASQLLKVINKRGGSIVNRSELVADPESPALGAVGPRVWNNCASFLYIDFDSSEIDADYLDNTRVHPEDYDLGRKMAADALELDEEDIEAEQAENGAGAIVRKLIKDDAQEKVNDLILEEYAEQLEKNFNQRKRATLETIRAELQLPYEELRRNFSLLSTNEIFTMFTGETPESLCDNMVVPVSIKRVTDEYVEVKMDCGIEGVVSSVYISSKPDVSPRQLFSVHQTVRAKLLFLNRKQLNAQFSLIEDQVRKPYRKEFDHLPDEWDDQQEQKDREAMQEKTDSSGRTQRVIKHPLFRPFNSMRAEEYLGSQARGDVVIRPSSKGPEHLAVTWKVSDNVYQHIDVLEMDKTNQYASGGTLKVGGKYTYSDLDELIVNHVKAMAKKVDEIMLHDKYQSGSKAETGKHLPHYLNCPQEKADKYCRALADDLHRS